MSERMTVEISFTRFSELVEGQRFITVDDILRRQTSQVAAICVKMNCASPKGEKRNARWCTSNPQNLEQEIAYFVIPEDFQVIRVL